MIKKFDEYIAERLFNSNVVRASKDTLRKEDGTKVKTMMGFPVILQEPDIDISSFLIYTLGSAIRKKYGWTVNDIEHHERMKVNQMINGEKDHTMLIDENKKIWMWWCPWKNVSGEKSWEPDYREMFTGMNEQDYNAIYQALGEWIQTKHLIMMQGYAVFELISRRVFKQIPDDELLRGFRSDFYDEFGHIDDIFGITVEDDSAAHRIPEFGIHIHNYQVLCSLNEMLKYRNEYFGEEFISDDRLTV